jgi:FKBP-type peptidyl-prolyl cis-trans isomerase 2
MARKRRRSVKKKASREREKRTEKPEAKEKVAEKSAAKGARKKGGKEKPAFSSYVSGKNALYVVAAIVIISLVAWRLGTFSIPSADDTAAAADEVLQEGSGPDVLTGDKVTVEYTGMYADGEVFDSGEIEFVVGSGQMIEGFDEAVAGMKEGGEKTFTIPPEKAYGDSDPSKVLDVPLTRVLNKTVEITASDFNSAFGEEPVEGETYFEEGMVWPIKVLSVSGSSLVIEHMPEDGAEIDSPYGTETVVINGSELVITLVPEIGSSVSTIYGDVKIVEADEDSMKLDFNHPLAGKELTFTVKVINVTKVDAMEGACAGMDVVKSGKPVLDVFIMSYCPYGLQMQKAVLPVMELLGDKAEINIKWVSYIMHGKQEIDENTRQYCIQKDFPDMYLDYANCFTVSGSVEDCLSDAGIDTAALDACIAEADAQFNITGLYEDQSTWSGGMYPLYMVDVAENQLYGVGGSPTTVLNGKVISINRSPEDVKKAVCCAFNEMPEECSTTLSTAAASPGIGGGTGDSSSGSC